MQIGDVARLAGVSVRTLRYYDEIGLLSPSEQTQAGYRIYTEAELERLQEILFFRELDFALEEIKEILENPDYDRRQALGRHRELLLAKRDRLSGLIELVERTMRGERDLSFKQFDAQQIERAKREYADEAKARWGGTQAYAQSEQRTAQYGKAQWDEIGAQMGEIFAAFAALRGQDPAGEAAQAQVRRWQAHITKNFYDCTDEILAGLGQMYTADERFKKNIDRYGEGTAQMMADAIAAYCAKK